MSFERINFIPKDHRYEHLDNLANDIAHFLKKYTSKLEKFSEFMRISSSWSKNNYHNKMDQWKSSFIRRRKSAAIDTIEFAEFMEKIYLVCNNDEELKKMRGLIPEKLIENIYQIRFYGISPLKLEYGCKVSIDGNQVIYTPDFSYENSIDSDERKVTVDIGKWDGKKAEFVEIKLSPESFHSKDINYLLKLRQKMNNVELDHDIFLISFGNKDAIEGKLEQIGISQLQDFYFIFRDEIFSLENIAS